MGTARNKGNVAFDGAVDLSGATVTYPTGGAGTSALADGAVTPVKQSAGHRELAADAACVIAATDRSIELNKTAATTAVTMTATFAGHRVRVYLGVRSGGDATLAVTRGATSLTVTLDAVGEGCDLVYNGSAWKLQALLGGATAA